MDLNTLYLHKISSVKLTIEDIFLEEDDPNWKTNHPLGPLHIQIRCRLCNKIIQSDLKEYGWFENRGFVKANLIPHLKEH